ncbi:MAG: deoxyguanosinetriphosphate triphosphohydrolase [Eubacteriales bacterium]|nr:deoxyguanosinetriphosphate triphosphohydrolase [Eubacteriales bacterium]
MTIREEIEIIEEKTLSKYAILSKNSKGRLIKEDECTIRTCFMRDRDRILHSKAFRRLKHKTQVFLIPEGDHYRTRLTHTLEVSQTARTISKALGLNQDLTEAIALGHDLGHTPFGHTGEKILDKLLENGFEHSKQSLRIVELLEKNGEGLNLTCEVKDGILNHRTKGRPFTLEGQVVRLSDKIAYINHDIDDAINAKIIKEKDLPLKITKILGDSVRKRIDTLIKDIIINSKNKNEILMSSSVYDAMHEIRKWMFDRVYLDSIAKEEEGKAQELIQTLFYYYKNNLNEMPDEYIKLINNGENEEQVVCDYISGMTDDYAIMKFEKLFVPKGWRIKE